MTIQPQFTARKGTTTTPAGMASKSVSTAQRFDMLPISGKQPPSLMAILKTKQRSSDPIEKAKASVEALKQTITAKKASSRPAKVNTKPAPATQTAMVSKAEYVALTKKVEALEDMVAALTEAMANRDAESHKAETAAKIQRRGFGLGW